MKKKKKYSFADVVDLFKPVSEYTRADLEALLRHTESALVDLEVKRDVLRAVKAEVESELRAGRRATPPARG